MTTSRPVPLPAPRPADVGRWLKDLGADRSGSEWQTVLYWRGLTTLAEFEAAVPGVRPVDAIDALVVAYRVAFACPACAGRTADGLPHADCAAYMASVGGAS